MAVDLSAVGYKGAEYVHNQGIPLGEAVLLGVHESLSPAIFGFTLIGIASLLVTCGLARESNA
ncbi:MAG: hypothetical protein QM756_34260 [Polyangiaceae bacterium]